MRKGSMLNVHNAAKAIVLFFIGLAFFLLIWPYGMEEDGVFEITDPSQVYMFEDSSRSSHADVVEASITGYLDGTGTVEIYYPDTIHRVWTFELPSGRIDSSGRWDFYGGGGFGLITFPERQKRPFENRYEGLLSTQAARVVRPLVH